MFMSLFIIFFVGISVGFLFEKVHIPKIIWYLILGVLMSSSVLGLIDDTLYSVSSYIRQIALVIILTRSGLSLDLKKLKTIGRSAILMCFVPACFEIIGITIFAPLLLGISLFEAMLLGTVIAAVSPAVVVPRMIKLQEDEFVQNKTISELIMAGSSFDDVFVIGLFYSFKNLVATSVFSIASILMIPVSVLLGILLGTIVGFLYVLIMKKIDLPIYVHVILVLGLSFGMIAVENLLKNIISISSLLGIIALAVIIRIFFNEKALLIQKTYNSLWQGFEILLFALVGATVDIKYVFSSQGAIMIGVIFIGLIFRSLGVLLCLIKTNYSVRERLYIIISYLPKATVQASIGAIALSEGLACGDIILTGAVIAILITAPLGAILMDNLKKKLLYYRL